MDGKCRVIFRSGHEGEKLKQLTRKTQNINKQSNNKKPNKQTNKGFQPIGSLTFFAFYAENSVNNQIYVIFSRIFQSVGVPSYAHGLHAVH